MKREQVLKSNLCPCKTVNVGEILLMCLQVMIKHSLSLLCLMDIFQMINTIFNNQIMPISKYMLNKLMNVNSDSIFYHILCNKCNKYFGTFTDFKNGIKCTCGHNLQSSKIGSFFIEVDVKDQLIKLLSDQQIINSLQDRFQRKKKNINGLEDIYDGKIYKAYTKDYNLLVNPWNFSYTFNTDVCQTSFHSKVTVWPIYFMLHELPDHLRRKHMLLAVGIEN